MILMGKISQENIQSRANGSSEGNDQLFSLPKSPNRFTNMELNTKLLDSILFIATHYPSSFYGKLAKSWAFA